MLKTATTLAIGLGLLLLTAITPSIADEPHLAQGVFCETLDQAKAFVQKYDGGDVVALLTELNGQAGVQGGCGTASVLIVTSKQFDVMDTPTGKWQMVEVQVLGQKDTNGLRMLHAPLVQYTAFKPLALEPADCKNCI